jgi:hypothetical protein
MTVHEPGVEPPSGQILELLPGPALEQVQVKPAMGPLQVGEQAVDAQIAGIDVQPQTQDTRQLFLEGTGAVADRVDHA